MSATSLTFEQTCSDPAPTLELTLTNTSAAALTWTGESAGPGLFVDFYPASSTLAPGEEVTLVVWPVPDLWGSPTSPQSGELTIDSDLSGQAPRVISITDDIVSLPGAPPPVFDFGMVPIGTTVTLIESDPWPNPYFVAVGSDNVAFWVVPELVSQAGDDVTVTFTPETEGPASATLTHNAASIPLCPPNTSLATGTGYYDTTCSLVPEGAPCGAQAQCVGGQCTSP